MDENVQEVTELAITSTDINSNLIVSVLDDKVSKATVYNAINDAKSLSEESPEVLALSAIMLQPGTRAVSGDACINTTLIADTGDAYFTQSNGIARAARDLLSMYDNDVRGVVVRIMEREIGNGRTMKYLRVQD